PAGPGHECSRRSVRAGRNSSVAGNARSRKSFPPPRRRGARQRSPIAHAGDGTQLVKASSSQVRNAPTPAGGQGPGMRLYDEGLKALEMQDREAALAKFQEAWKFQDQLDPAIPQQLKDKLTSLRAATAQPVPAVGAPPSPLEQVNSQQEVLRQKLYREILAEERAAKELAQRDPRGALANLTKLRDRVRGAE